MRCVGVARRSSEVVLLAERFPVDTVEGLETDLTANYVHTFTYIYCISMRFCVYAHIVRQFLLIGLW